MNYIHSLLKMSHLKKPHIILLAFVVGVLYRLLLSLQGLDAVDAGFNMTYFQHIFDRPDAMPYSFCYYLTGLVGGCWQWAFGSWGLWGSRLFEILTMSAAVLLTYQSFKPWLPSQRMAGWAILMSFLFPSFVIVFHYNTLTFLLIAASTYCMRRWAQGDSKGWLVAAGYLVGLCFFARIVNVSMAALCLIPLMAGWRTSAKRALSLGSIYAGGMLMGVLSVVALLLLTHQWIYFQEGVMDAFGFFHGEGTSHTSGNLIIVYLKSWLNTGLQVLALALIFFLYVKAEQCSKPWRISARTALIIALFVLIVTSLPVLSAFASCLVLMLVPAFRREISSTLMILLGYVILAASLFPLGSDMGVPGVYHWYGALMVVPAACCVAQSSWEGYRPVLWYLYGFVFIALVGKTILKPYGEQQPRYMLTEQALDGKLNVWTAPDRARQYQHIVACIEKYNTDNPYMLIGNQASELYYATNRLPFTSNTQMETFTGDRLFAILDKQQRRHGRLPLVVFLKRGHEKPSPDDYQTSLYPWLQTQHYEVVYEDEDLKLFSTNKNMN